MKKNIKIITALVLTIVLLSSSLCLFAVNPVAPQKVRVGFFEFAGFQEKNDDGSLEGYGHEYLMEIAKYAGFEYEFVYASWAECLELLEKGEIDLLGSAQLTTERAEKFDFAMLESGVSYAVLSTSSNNTDLAYEDFDAFDGMRVGMLEGSSRNDAIKAYSEEHNFTIQPRIFKTQEQLTDALNTGHVDAVLTSNLRKATNERVVAKFMPSHFYFMTTKGNHDIMNAVNNAQTQIKLTNPHYDSLLFEKYYSLETSDMPVFTRAERDYIESHPTLKVSYIPSEKPLTSNDENDDFSGLFYDIFAQIEENTGIKFEYVPVKSLNDARMLLNTGEVDLISAVDADNISSTFSDVLLTNQYITTLNVLVTDPLTKHDDKLKFAVTSCFSQAYNQNLDPSTLKIYGSTQECFDALLKGEVSGIYANTYIANMLRTQHTYSRLALTTLTSIKDIFCIGMRKNVDPRLISILNKSILYISPNELQETVLKNTVIPHQLTIKDFVYQNPFETIAVILVFMLIVIAFICYVAFLRSSSNKRTFNLLYIDNLTGISNFNHFKQNFKKILGEEGKSNYALIYTNIEHFKDFNADFGYAQGDFVLSTVASILSHNISNDELCARVANDNFVVLLKFENETEIISRLEEMFSEFKKIPQNEHNFYKLVFTSGIYVVKDDDENPSQIVDNANVARKTIRVINQNSYAFYDDLLRNILLAEREIESMMEQAMIDGQFITYFQPKIDLKTTKIVGAEALVRWQHPTRGLIPPLSFIPLFERNGFVVDVDLHVFESVCRVLRKHIDEGHIPVPISSNFSRLHFTTMDFINKINTIVNKYDIPPELIDIEITESMMDENSSMVMDILTELRQYGYQISMDDFGTGYSSLNLLKNLPVDTLKLDKDFMQKGIVSEKERIIIGGFVSIAKKLSISVVCEGVETHEQVVFLRKIGCDIAQGYLYAKPMPLLAYENKLYGDGI